MVRRIKKIQLHELLGGIGFTLLMVGAGTVDSDLIVTPAVMVILGLGCLIWAAWESGEMKKPR